MKIAIQVVVSFLITTTFFVRDAASADPWCSIRADSPKCVFQAGCEKLDTAQRCACQWGLIEQSFAETELPFVAKLTALYAAKDEQAAVLLGSKLGVDKMMEFSGKLAMIDQMTPSKCGPSKVQPAPTSPTPIQPRTDAQQPEKWQPKSTGSQADIALETVGYLLMGKPDAPFSINPVTRTLQGSYQGRDVTVKETGHCRYEAQGRWTVAGITERYRFDFADKKYALQAIRTKRGAYESRALSVRGVEACLSQDTKEAVGNPQLKAGQCADSFNFFASLDDPVRTTLPALNYVMLYHCSPPSAVMQSDTPIKAAKPVIDWKPFSTEPHFSALEAVAYLVGGFRVVHSKSLTKGSKLTLGTPDHVVTVQETEKCAFRVTESYAGMQDDYTVRIASSNWATQEGMFVSEAGAQPGLFVKGIEIVSHGQQIGGNPHVRLNTPTDEFVFYGFGENPETLLRVFDFVGNGYCKGQPVD